MAKITDDVNAKFDDARQKVKKLFLDIVRSVDPDYEYTEDDE